MSRPGKWAVWSDSELRRTRAALPPHTDRDPRNLAAGLVLILFAPLVAMLPLLRAAETSSTWEVEGMVRGSGSRCLGRSSLARPEAG